MTDIDFYILSAQQPEQRLDFACRLIEKAYRSRCKVYVHFDTQAQASNFDERLWSYRESSFVPHKLIDDVEKADENCAVILGFGDHTPDFFDVLVNLGQTIPSTFARYKRVLEVVIQQDEVLADTRNHYRHYKERGYPIQNIDMRMSD